MLHLKVAPKIKKTLLNGTAIAFLFSTTTAFAQVENATIIADPSRIAQELMDTDKLPELSAEIEIKDVVLQNAPDNAENIRFKFETLKIDGVGAYEAKDLDPLYRDMLGTTVSLADIYLLSNTMTNKYRNDGYILTQVIVPPQTIEGGIARLRVVEGFIDQIFIEGEAQESAAKQIREYAENLRKDGILDAGKLEHYLLLINDLPGLTARSVLSPSTTTTGASDLTIIIERDHYEASVTIDNYGSRYLGPYQGIFSGSINSRFGFNEKITGRFALNGDKDRTNELVFASLSYEQPITRFGTKIKLQASTSSTEPGYNLDEFDVKGNAQFLSVGLSHPFIRSRTTNIYARASVDLRDVVSKNNLEPTRRDRIRSARAGATVQFMDTLFGVGINALDIEISRGIGSFGASDKGDANLTRSLGNPKYTKAELQVQRLQRISSSVNLLLSGQGQWSATPLLSSEEFGVGGMNIGRGYDSSEIVGDDGIAGKIELQWNEPRKISYIKDYQLFGYLDSGTVWNQDATTSAAKRESITSTGFGVNADITDTYKASLGVAFPLTRDVDTTRDRGPRYYFSISHQF